MRRAVQVKSYLRRLGTALVESTAILVVMSVVYILGYVACYQALPRWK